MFRRVRSDIAHDIRTAPHADPERLREAVQRPLRQPQRLQAFVGEPILTVNRVPCSSRPRVDAFEHPAQPGAALGTVVELHEDVAPVAHENRRDDVVLNVVKVVLQISGGQSLCRRWSEHCRILEGKNSRQVAAYSSAAGSGLQLMPEAGSACRSFSRYAACFPFVVLTRSATSSYCHWRATSVSIMASLGTAWYG